MKNSKALALPLFIGLALILFSIWRRYAGLNFESIDMKEYIEIWYDFLSRKGFHDGLGTSFSNYTPPYLYLLAVATKTKSFLSWIVGIKLIGILFDVYGALITGLLVFKKYKKIEISFLAGSIYFALPTVWLNSSVWGQVDGIYTAFILTSLLFFLMDRPNLALIFFGLAFAFKLQAIFFLPFLLVLFLQGRIKWYNFLWIPITYLFMMLPAAAFGRPWSELTTIYVEQIKQSGIENIWTYNGQNIYAFFPSSLPRALSTYFTILAGILILVWVFFTYRRNKLHDPQQIIFIALVAVMLVPSVLPLMHERYFFLAETISLVLAFYVPSLWLLPFAMQASTYLAYVNFLYPNPVYDNTRLYAAAIINLTLFAYLLYYQFGHFQNLQADQ